MISQPSLDFKLTAILCDEVDSTLSMLRAFGLIYRRHNNILTYMCIYVCIVGPLYKGHVGTLNSSPYYRGFLNLEVT